VYAGPQERAVRGKCLWISAFVVFTLLTRAYGQVNGYSYQRAIVINHSLVPADETNFPVLVSGTFPDLATVANGGNVQNAQGNDIIFTSDAAGQNMLPFEQDDRLPDF
jgi:hypothetical protein